MTPTGPPPTSRMATEAYGENVGSVEPDRRALMRQAQSRWQFMRMAQKPVAHVVFPAKQQRHHGQDDVVQCHADGRPHDAAAQQPCDAC